MLDNRKRFADWAFLLALMLYIIFGIRSVPPHADEYMQMAMVRDTFYLARGEFARMAYAPPVQIDSEQYLRLLNGTITKNLIGMVWMTNGKSDADLPGIFQWGLSVEENQARGTIPTVQDLELARWPSTIMTALGVIPIFLLGWHLRVRSLAYPAALLYTLHPAILINGRRAMMEGSLMLFSLLTMYWLVAMIVAEHSASATGYMRRLRPALRYIILGILIGLTAASKHTGITIGAAALFAVLTAGILRSRSWRAVVRVALSVITAALIWWLLNPAYWRDPIGAFNATVSARVDLLNTQTGQGALAYPSVLDRVGALFTQPFLTPPQYYEAPTWANVITTEIAAYERSTTNGLDWGLIPGLGLTVLALIGLAALVYDARHFDLIAWAILCWAGATTVISLLVPMAWQRYYLPITLVAILLAAAGLGRLLVRRSDSDTRSEQFTPPADVTHPLPGG